MSWLAALTKHVARHPIGLLRLKPNEVAKCDEKIRRKLSLIRPHEELDGIKTPAIMILFGELAGALVGYFALAASKGAVGDLDSRITLRTGSRLLFTSEAELRDGITDTALVNHFDKSVGSRASVIRLTPKVSEAVLSFIGDKAEHSIGLRRIHSILFAPKIFTGNRAFQNDALNLALKAFKLDFNAEAVELSVSDDGESELTRLPVYEDQVVNHGGQTVAGMDKIGSDITGRAVFKRGEEIMEVFTANKLPLEEVFGVDLVYFHRTRQNIVMVQFKMLEREAKGQWVYRPNEQMKEELERMDKFSEECSPGDHEYRMCPGAFYMKFVKRNSALDAAHIVISLLHYKMIVADPDCKGPKGGTQISYDTLDGRYLRDEGFISLIRSGYIGSYSGTTEHFAALISAIVSAGKAAVGAIVSPDKTSGQSSTVDAGRG